MPCTFTLAFLRAGALAPSTLAGWFAAIFKWILFGFAWLVGGVLLAATCFGLWQSAKQRRLLREYVQQKDLRATGKVLPPTLKPRSGAFEPGVTVSDCYTGTRNGYEIALFKILIGRGESAISRAVVAVRREPIEPVWPKLLQKELLVDTSSAPGWVLVSRNNGQQNARIVETILARVCTEPGHPLG
jgi:hypothetical protein